MEEPKLLDVIRFDDGNRFRILFDDGSTYALIQLDITRINLFTMVKNTIVKHLLLGDYQIVEDKTKIAIDLNELTPFQRETLKFASEIVYQIFEEYTDVRDLINQKHKTVIQRVLHENEICKATLWKYIRLYLQSGYDKNSLIPQPRKVKSVRISPNKYGRKSFKNLNHKSGCSTY
jgi:hypothetical protein